jgi:hypothetical protein
MRIVVAAMLLPAAALASQFDGTWKMRTDSIKVTGKADQFQVLDGVYTCKSCAPEIKVKADGTDQKVEGHDYYDTVAVTVVGPAAIQVVQKKAGKLAFTYNLSVSTDGKTLTGKVQDYTGGQMGVGQMTETRRAAGPPGSHPISGSWQPEQVTDLNEAARTVAYQMTNDQFSMHWNGQSYNAKFDGKEYPVQNDPGKTLVTVKRLNDHTIEEIDHRQGKVTDEIRLAAATDGKTIEVTDNDVVHHQIVTYVLDKQP